MPPKSAQAGKKRAHDETGSPGDAGASQAKRTADAAADAAGPSSDPAPSKPSYATYYGRRLSKGPNGEAFLPRILPLECKEKINQIPIPSSWFLGIDGSSDQSASTGSRVWWENNQQWLEKNTDKVRLSDNAYVLKDSAFERDVVVIKEGTGNADWDFICIAAPDSDDDDDDEEEDEEEEEEEAGSRDENSMEKMKMVGKLASLYPDHKHIVSMLGFDRLQWWGLEALKRSLDDFDMHIYNDFADYGKIEVIENIFLHFERLLGKRAAGYRELWSELEGFALVLEGGLLDFTMCDDSQKRGEIIEMIGHLTLFVFDTLEKMGALGPDTDVPNLGFILATLMKWSWDITSDLDSWWPMGGWILPLLDRAKEHNITLGGPKGFDKMYKELVENRLKTNKKFKSTSLTTKLRPYKAKYAERAVLFSRSMIGGNQFDIAEFSEEEKMRFSFGLGE